VLVNNGTYDDQMDVWVSLKNKISSEEISGRLGVEGMAAIVRRGRPSWFAHLEQKGSDDWVSACRCIEVARPKNRGRSKKP